MATSVSNHPDDGDGEDEDDDNHQNFESATATAKTKTTMNTKKNTKTIPAPPWKQRSPSNHKSSKNKSSSSLMWRPTVQDVIRISYGQPAKRKRTGSRGVPHRLNRDERTLFDLAMTERGYLEVIGNAWRSQRRESPLLNTYRSYCDAMAQACIVLHKTNGKNVDIDGRIRDRVVVDLSTLRLNHAELDAIIEQCRERVRHERMDLMDAVADFRKDTTASGHWIVEEEEEEEEEEYDEEGEVDDDGEEDDADEKSSSSSSTSSSLSSTTTSSSSPSWLGRPIYQVPPFTMEWSFDSNRRSDAKALAKCFADSSWFQTAPVKPRARSQKPKGVKPGKSRRHGGYGIG